ncbi:hypothetical protein ACFX1T_013255 [Malus domestica]
MLAIEYHRKFTNLSFYCPEIAKNPREMLHHFKKGTHTQLCSLATSTLCSTYQQFFEVLLHVKDSENSSDDDDGDKDNSNAQRKITEGSHLLALEGLRILRKMEIVLDHRVMVQVLTHRERAAIPPAAQTLATLVLHYVAYAITVITVSVKRGVVDVIHAARWGIWLISIRRISRNLNLLLYHLQFWNLSIDRLWWCLPLPG